MSVFFWFGYAVFFFLVCLEVGFSLAWLCGSFLLVCLSVGFPLVWLCVVFMMVCLYVGFHLVWLCGVFFLVCLCMLVFLWFGSVVFSFWFAHTSVFLGFAYM